MKLAPIPRCTRDLRAVFCGHWWLSDLFEDARQMGWHHLAFALPGVLPCCGVPWGEKERTPAPVCYNDHLCWQCPVLSRVRPLTGVSYPYPHPPCSLPASLDAVDQVFSLYAFAHLRWCFSFWVMPPCARSPSKSGLLHLCCVQGGCLPASAAPHPLKVKCSETEATLWVVCNSF